MLHETLQLHLPQSTPVQTVHATAVDLREQLQQLPGVALAHVALNLPGCWGGGTCTVDLHWHAGADPSAATALLQAATGGGAIDRVTYQRIGGGQRAPGLCAGVWRTLLLRVRAGTPEAQQHALEHDLLRMPQYMPSIHNWQLARVSGGHSAHGWTHVWQQEFADLSDLHGEYMLHPYHWAWVDRWFDPEHPHWAVDAIAHIFSPLHTSVLAPAPIPAPTANPTHQQEMA